MRRAALDIVGTMCEEARKREGVARRLALAIVLAVASGIARVTPAYAHMGTGLPGGFESGFKHPFSGFDHLLAMVSVGMWGAFLGRPLLYALPVIFPCMMVAGAILGMLLVPMPPVELGIAVSVLVLGRSKHPRGPLARSSRPSQSFMGMRTEWSCRRRRTRSATASDSCSRRVSFMSVESASVF